MATTSSKIITDFQDVLNAYNPRANKTRNVLSRYEKTKILGMRMEQLARGAPTYLPNDQMPNPITIRALALKELELVLLPYIVQRDLANGIVEYWRLQDMIIT